MDGKRIHLRPLASAQVIHFPNSLDETREAVIAQMQNHMATLAGRNGSYLARQMFVEAAVAVAVRAAMEVGAVEDTREALNHAFDFECGIVGFASA